jgi:hypothetical protein
MLSHRHMNVRADYKVIPRGHRAGAGASSRSSSRATILVDGKLTACALEALDVGVETMVVPLHRWRYFLTCADEGIHFVTDALHDLLDALKTTVLVVNLGVGYTVLALVAMTVRVARVRVLPRRAAQGYRLLARRSILTGRDGSILRHVDILPDALQSCSYDKALESLPGILPVSTNNRIQSRSRHAYGVRFLHHLYGR